MSDDKEEKLLVQLIRTRTPKDCLKFFDGRDTDDRRRFAKLAAQTLKDIEKEWYGNPGKSKPLFGRPLHEQRNNASVCIFATATLAEVKKLGWRALPNDGFIVDVVCQTQPTWIDEWAQEMSESDPSTYRHIRPLFEAGLCEKPTGDAYIIGMIDGLSGWHPTPSANWDNDTPLAERIRRSPDICDEDVWRLFEVEGNGETSLANHEKYLGSKVGGWNRALIELSEDGTLSRDRLLDDSLNALERDFAQFRAGWFSRFHESLKPTLEERVARRDLYLRLIGSSIPPTVSFALKAVAPLDKAGELPPKQIVDSIEPALQARAKGTVNAGLRLLANAVKREPELAVDASALAATALIHEATDVQKKALDLIDSLGAADQPDVIAALANYTDGIAPSLQSRFIEMVGDNSPLPPSETEFGTNDPIVSSVVPIESFDEFLREFLRVLEDVSRPLEVERVLEGLARFGAAKPADFDKVVGPLRKRSAAVVKRQSGDQLQHQFARLAYAYTAGEMLSIEDKVRYAEFEFGGYRAGAEREDRTFEGVFLRRCSRLLSQVAAGQQLPLLSAPTDSRGFVAANSLIARYAEYREARYVPGELDTALALMRLSPDDRDEALRSFAPWDETERAIAYALGAELSVNKTDWLWVAANAARLPYEDNPRIFRKHGRGLPDAGQRATYHFSFEKMQYFTWLWVSVQPTIKRRVPLSFVATTFHLTTASKNSYGSVCGYHVNMIRWCSTVWPLNPEPFYSQGVLVFDHSQRLANSPYVAFLEPMLESHNRIGRTGSVLLLLGLASTDPAVKSVAIDAAISAIAEERLGLDDMHDAFAMLLPSGHAPVGRWTKSLSEVSSVTTEHAKFVRDVIEGSLNHNPAEPPRDIGGLIELLYELTVGLKAPVSNSDTLDYLKGLQGGGKPKKFATRLLSDATS